ncbi:MAG TPA: hypothetical protein VFU21_31015, partial [Kofleriaceae bacterium]|nr:hypothetical protein [Kofleriaceae bacterium]
MAPRQPLVGADGVLERLAALEGRLAGRRHLASVTIELDEPIDPAAAVFASRLASDRWFCWEQPDAGFALAGLGS